MTEQSMFHSLQACKNLENFLLCVLKLIVTVGSAWFVWHIEVQGGAVVIYLGYWGKIYRSRIPGLIYESESTGVHLLSHFLKAIVGLNLFWMAGRGWVCGSFVVLWGTWISGQNWGILWGICNFTSISGGARAALWTPGLQQRVSIHPLPSASFPCTGNSLTLCFLFIYPPNPPLCSLSLECWEA